MKENVIEVSHLHKAFGKVKAVRDLSFRVKRGEFEKPGSTIWNYR